MTAYIGAIWAQSRDGVIGADGGIPWRVPEDLAHFRDVTMGDPVIMGRKTWDSLPERFRPLPGRRNIVVTRNPDWAARGAQRASSLSEALALSSSETTWIIGGEELLRRALEIVDVLEVTEVDLAVGGDAFAPDVTGWELAPGSEADWRTSRTGIRYRFLTYRRALS